MRLFEKFLERFTLLPYPIFEIFAISGTLSLLSMQNFVKLNFFLNFLLEMIINMKFSLVVYTLEKKTVHVSILANDVMNHNGAPQSKKYFYHYWRALVP